MRGTNFNWRKEMSEALSDFTIKFEFPGESERNKDACDLDTWSVGVHNGGSASYGGGSGVGRCSWNNFTGSMKTNTATSRLLAACAGGNHEGTAELICHKAGGAREPFLVMKFSKVLITSVTIAGVETDVPRDTFSFDYKFVEFVYRKQDDKGTLSGTYPLKWNVTENKLV
jgi:type VI secretion system secreted protein Hcp